MVSSESHLVPKVHPLDRAAEADDPYTLHATPVEGDPEVMLECLVQEYAWMGWGLPQILRLFGDPNYPALNGLLAHYGEEGVRRRVAAAQGRTGVFRFSGTVRDEPEPDDDDPELISLGTSRVPAPKGNSHVQGL
jgi:hypothetical protein